MPLKDGFGETRSYTTIWHSLIDQPNATGVVWEPLPHSFGFDAVHIAYRVRVTSIESCSVGVLFQIGTAGAKPSDI